MGAAESLHTFAVPLLCQDRLVTSGCGVVASLVRVADGVLNPVALPSLVTLPDPSFDAGRHFVIVSL